MQSPKYSLVSQNFDGISAPDMGSKTNLHKVFVYGTLKAGEPNAEWFSKDQKAHYKFLCQAQTIQKFPLIIGTKYNIPFLLHKPGDGYFVKGEVYEVDDKVLANLDVLEDHPMFYVREEDYVKVIHSEGDNPEVIKVWIYFMKNFRPEMLEKPMYESYSSRGVHGLPYIKRYLRDATYDFRAEIVRD